VPKCQPLSSCFRNLYMITHRPNISQNERHCRRLWSYQIVDQEVYEYIYTQFLIISLARKRVEWGRRDGDEGGMREEGWRWGRVGVISWSCLIHAVLQTLGQKRNDDIYIPFYDITVDCPGRNLPKLTLKSNKSETWLIHTYPASAKIRCRSLTKSKINPKPHGSG
jgi:hypothetical protein